MPFIRESSSSAQALRELHERVSALEARMAEGYVRPAGVNASDEDHQNWIRTTLKECPDRPTVAELLSVKPAQYNDAVVREMVRQMVESGQLYINSSGNLFYRQPSEPVPADKTKWAWVKEGL